MSRRLVDGQYPHITNQFASVDTEVESWPGENIRLTARMNGCGGVKERVTEKGRQKNI